ncbi:hypothetical protein RclHR1_21790003 [Rhizophagus clarus]|uniref:Uncharacterized protein n=1 Tax=Rhizophagus clarus TaxID=94130 RepID=A0A2Z6QTH0_9GLOM|nr:hypothetical protein RclHR1_21790003 [Rhizophagus clarus]
MTEDIYKDMAKRPDIFDLNDSKTIRLFKDETTGSMITESFHINSKLYHYILADKSTNSRHKGGYYQKPCTDLVLGLPWLYLRKAKIDIQKEGIKIYGDFVPFCKGPDNSDSEADSSKLSLAEEAYTIKEPRESDLDHMPPIIIKRKIHNENKKSDNKTTKPKRNPTRACKNN